MGIELAWAVGGLHLSRTCDGKGRISFGNRTVQELSKRGSSRVRLSTQFTGLTQAVGIRASGLLTMRFPNPHDTLSVWVNQNTPFPHKVLRHCQVFSVYDRNKLTNQVSRRLEQTNFIRRDVKWKRKYDLRIGTEHRVPKFWTHTGSNIFFYRTTFLLHLLLLQSIKIPRDRQIQFKAPKSQGRSQSRGSLRYQKHDKSEFEKVWGQGQYTVPYIIMLLSVYNLEQNHHIHI